MFRLTSLLCFTLLSVQAAPELNPLQKSKNLESFDLVWTTVKEQYWDPKLGGLDWDSVRTELRPQMERATTMEEARRVLQAMTDRLGVSHFAVLPTEVYRDVQSDGTPAENGSTGMEVEAVEGRAMVRTVDPDGPAARAGIRPGWILTKAGDRELDPLLQKILEANPPHVGLMLRSVIRWRLHGRTGQTLALELLDSKDQKQNVPLQLAPPKGKIAQFGLLPPTPVWIESKKVENRIGYVHFNIFLQPAEIVPKFGEAVEACAKCDGFIIDLRGNPGGIGFMATGMAGWFVDKKNLQLGTIITRETKLKFVINPRGETFRGKLAVLVDEGSASTSEIFAGGLKDLGRARIFGTRTPGAALPSVIIHLPNGDGFQYAVANYISEGGKPLEGLGVTPDQEVKLTRAALLTGRDPVMDAAAQWIEGK